MDETTSKVEHTPGPWSVGESDMGYLAVVPPGHGEREPDGRLYLPVPICRVGVGYNRSEAEAIANAHLLAAAPKLLAELRDAEIEARNELARLRILGATDGPAHALWAEKQARWSMAINEATGTD